MGDVNVYHILAITHSILCLIASVHSTNNSSAIGGLFVYPLNRNCVSC